MSRPVRDHSNPAIGLVLAPFERIQDVGLDGKLAAAALGVLTFLTTDLSMLLVGVLLLTSAMDWIVGRAAAHRRDEFSTDVSAWGLQSKIAGVVLVLLVRIVEGTVYQATVNIYEIPLFAAGGLAAATASALIWQDIDSIDRHRQTLGGTPIPVLTNVLKIGRKISESFTSGDHKKGNRP